MCLTVCSVEEGTYFLLAAQDTKMHVSSCQHPVYIRVPAAPSVSGAALVVGAVGNLSSIHKPMLQKKPCLNMTVAALRYSVAYSCLCRQ